MLVKKSYNDKSETLGHKDFALQDDFEEPQDMEELLEAKSEKLSWGTSDSFGFSLGQTRLFTS